MHAHMHAHMHMHMRTRARAAARRRILILTQIDQFRVVRDLRTKIRIIILDHFWKCAGHSHPDINPILWVHT